MPRKNDYQLQVLKWIETGNVEARLHGELRNWKYFYDEDKRGYIRAINPRSMKTILQCGYAATQSIKGSRWTMKVALTSKGKERIKEIQNAE